MKMSSIQREVLDEALLRKQILEPFRKKIFLLLSILLIVVCIYFSFEVGEFLLNFNVYEFSNPLTALLDCFDDVILPIILLCLTVKGLLLTK
jgi:hypothetical protein